MDSSKKNDRIKKLYFLQLKTEKKGKGEERIVLYNNGLVVSFFLLLIFVDTIKNFYFFSTPLSLNERLLFGDIVISDNEEQRLFNFILWVGYFFTFIYIFSYYFDPEKAHLKRFHQLSQFLTVLDPNEYGRKFFFTKECAEKHFNEIKLRVRICQFLIYSYAASSNSYYLVSVYLLVDRGYSFKQIARFTCPSIMVGFLAMMVCFNVSVRAFTIFMLHISLMNARMQRLTADLNRLNDRSKRKRLLSHLAHLNLLIVEFGTSRRYFGKSLCLVVPVVIATLGLFPTMVILSRRFFSNRLIMIYILNLTMLLLPIMKSNEEFKKAVRFAIFKSF